MARELTVLVRKNATLDWTHKESVQLSGPRPAKIGAGLQESTQPGKVSRR
jgi:hypothetical protein